jgi:hypothetical protein
MGKDLDPHSYEYLFLPLHLGRGSISWPTWSAFDPGIAMPIGSTARALQHHTSTGRLSLRHVPESLATYYNNSSSTTTVAVQASAAVWQYMRTCSLPTHCALATKTTMLGVAQNCSRHSSSCALANQTAKLTKTHPHTVLNVDCCMGTVHPHNSG